RNFPVLACDPVVHHAALFAASPAPVHVPCASLRVGRPQAPSPTHQVREPSDPFSPPRPSFQSPRRQTSTWCAPKPSSVHHPRPKRPVGRNACTSPRPPRRNRRVSDRGSALVRTH